MQIHVHAVHVPVSDEFFAYAEQHISTVLARFTDKLTRIEVHIQDQNAHKGGDDLRCLIEARPRGLDPLTAENRGDQIRETLHGAVLKLEHVLEKNFGKRAARRRSEG